MAFPIGFFAPLPIAMMIPFMATQSLMMMYTAGSAWQFGKRKISEKSNEEIKNMTLLNLMEEQTGNFESIIPPLHQQMEMSYRLQIDIFEEMIKIIPAFFESLMRAWNNSSLLQDFKDFDKTPLGNTIPRPDIQPALHEAHPITDPTLISHEDYVPEITIIDTGYSLVDFQAMATSQLEYKIEHELKGSEKSLAQGVINDRRDIIIQQTKEEETPKFVETPDDIGLQEWQSKLTTLSKDFLSLKASKYRLIAEQPQNRLNIISTYNSKMNTPYRKIQLMSQDYRNPNNKIRSRVLALRKTLADRKYYEF